MNLGIRQMQIFFSTCEFFVPSDAENPPISSRSRSSVANPSVDFNRHLRRLKIEYLKNNSSLNLTVTKILPVFLSASEDLVQVIVGLFL